MELRCPFSFDNPVYINRTCMVDETGKPTWLENNNIMECPDPPLNELLKDMSNQVVFAKLMWLTLYLSNNIGNSNSKSLKNHNQEC